MTDLGIEREEFAAVVAAVAESVYSFHERFEIGCVDTSDPEAALDALRWRLALLDEEVGEHARELNRGNIEKAVDEAVDIAYIALGTVLRLGRDGLAACIAVSRKNDAKSASTHGKRDETGKVTARE